MPLKRGSSLAVALLGVLLATCAKAPPVLPTRGVAVDVRVRVGRDALLDGDACACCHPTTAPTTAPCRCRHSEDIR